MASFMESMAIKLCEMSWWWWWSDSSCGVAMVAMWCDDGVGALVAGVVVEVIFTSTPVISVTNLLSAK